MKLIDKYIDKSIKYLQLSIDDPEIEFEYVFKDKISREQFKKIISYCNDKYEKDTNSTTLDIKVKDEKQLRITLNEIDSIKKYCKFEELQEIMDTSYMLKKRYLDSDDRPMFINNDDYNYRINVKQEIMLDDEDYRVTDVKDEWKSLKKHFRYKKRYSFITDDKLFRIDLTAVKSNVYNKELNNYEYAKTFKSANILHNPENYEIEIEYVGTSSKSILNYIED